MATGLASVVPVPRRLVQPHEAVKRTRDAAKTARRDELGRLEVGPQPGIFYLVVSRDQLGRSLRILQGLVAEARRRGYEVESAEGSYAARDGAGIAIGPHVYAIQVKEMTDRIPLTQEEQEAWKRGSHRISLLLQDEPEPPTHKHVVNGRLQLSLPHHWDGRRANWREGPRGTLDKKIASILREVEARSERDVFRDQERAREQEEWRRQEAEREARERQLRIEQGRADRLQHEIAAWRHAAGIREYVATLRARLPSLEIVERERIARWAEWALALADGSDPVVHPELIRGLADEESGDSPSPSRAGRVGGVK